MIIKDEIKKILILKLCCQGDVIQLTPIIDSLKINFPDAQIDFITSNWTSKTVRQFRNINKIIEIDYNLEKSGIKQSGVLWKLYRIIKKGNYDLVFLAHRNNIYGMLVRLTGIKYRLGFRGTKFLNYTAPYNDNLHESERYKEILTVNGLKTTDEAPKINLPAKVREIKSGIILSEKDLVVGIFPFGGVNPGTKMKIKRWDSEKYFKLSELILNDNPDAKIIFFEGKLNDEKIFKHPQNKNIIITDDFDLISICKIFITNDTGALHLAAAYGNSTLSIFGPSDPRILAPINNAREPDRHRYIWKKPNCSPCWTPQTSFDRKDKKFWKVNEFICHTGTVECMKEVQTDEVYKTFLDMVNCLK
jgi:ADP-heptose:LPS heptosyltransferase